MKNEISKVLVCLLLFFCAAIVVSYWAGCFVEEIISDSPEKTVADCSIADLAEIPGSDYLYYDENTNIVYYLTPYKSNGNSCRYVNGEIIEFISTVVIYDTTN